VLMTPLGAVKIFVNDYEVEFTAIKMDNLDPHCPDVNGRFLIQYEYKNEVKNQKIKCCIPSLNVTGEIESGERLEAISFYEENIKLTIGAEGEFNDFAKYLDYSGNYLRNGIQYITFPSTTDKKFKFGVCWIQPFTAENDVQTWFGADPYLMC
jgi:hypothetical protein